MGPIKLSIALSLDSDTQISVVHWLNPHLVGSILFPWIKTPVKPPYFCWKSPFHYRFCLAFLLRINERIPFFPMKTAMFPTSGLVPRHSLGFADQLLQQLVPLLLAAVFLDASGWLGWMVTWDWLMWWSLLGKDWMKMNGHWWKSMKIDENRWKSMNMVLISDVC